MERVCQTFTSAATERYMVDSAEIFQAQRQNEKGNKMDKNTELLQKILDKLDAIDSSVVGMQNDIAVIADAQAEKSKLSRS